MECHGAASADRVMQLGDEEADSVGQGRTSFNKLLVLAELVLALHSTIITLMFFSFVHVICMPELN